MDENRISIKEFAYIAGYSERHVYNLTKSHPELIGYDPFSSTCGRNKALEIVEIVGHRYSVYWAAATLSVTPQVIRNWAKLRGFGRKIGGVSSPIYLTWDEITTIGKLCNRY